MTLTYIIENSEMAQSIQKVTLSNILEKFIVAIERLERYQKIHQQDKLHIETFKDMIEHLIKVEKRRKNSLHF